MKTTYQKPEIKVSIVTEESALLTGTNEVTSTDGNGQVIYGGGSDGSEEQGGQPRAEQFNVWDE